MAFGGLSSSRAKRRKRHELLPLQQAPVQKDGAHDRREAVVQRVPVPEVEERADGVNEAIWRHAEDLRQAARYLLFDGYTLEEPEAQRIGLMLAEMAGAVAQGMAPEGPQRSAGSSELPSPVANGDAPKE
jgi:hypothetical protein